MSALCFFKFFPQMVMILLFILIIPDSSHAFLKVQGNRIVDEQDEPVYLNGFGLGGWLMPEGYMLGIPDISHNSPRDNDDIDGPTEIRLAIQDLIGEENIDEYYRLYEWNYVSEKDIARIKGWGFNSCRIPFNSQRFLPRELQPSTYPYKPLVWNYSAFEIMDSLVAWATRYEVYLILDMHGAPGAQNRHNISDANTPFTDAGYDGLWEEKRKYWPMAGAVWRVLAERYAQNRWVIGYDLLNEPNLPETDVHGGELESYGSWPDHPNDTLLDCYIQLTDSIRSVDTNKIIFAEGGYWAMNFTVLFESPWDDNLVWGFHHYPVPTGSGFFDKWREPWNDIIGTGMPLWYSEGGETDNTDEMMAMDSFFRSQDYICGFAWWTHKKVNRFSQPFKAPVTSGYQNILDYWAGTAQKPSKEDAKKWMFEFARNLNIDSCEYWSACVDGLGGDGGAPPAEPLNNEDPMIYENLTSAGYIPPLNNASVRECGIVDYRLIPGKKVEITYRLEKNSRTAELVFYNLRGAVRKKTINSNVKAGLNSTVVSLEDGAFEKNSRGCYILSIKSDGENISSRKINMIR